MHRVLLAMACTLVLAGCTSIPPGQRSALAHWRPSPNHSLRKPQLVVLHYTVEPTLEGSRRILSDPGRATPVSSHYLIDRDGRIEQLVADHLRARHAGAGRWGSFTDVNDVSIGIEIVNTGREPFPQAQIDALIALLQDLRARHRFDPRQVIAHADLAPGRKVDPGPQFPWRRLADAGFGLWPSAPAVEPPPDFDAWAALAAIGYPLDNRRAALHSFRLRFRGLDDGALQAGAEAPAPQPDAEDRRLLYALTTRSSD